MNHIKITRSLPAANTDASNLTSGTVPVARLPAATTSAVGAVELATTAEAVAGTDTTRAVTPAGLAADDVAQMAALLEREGLAFDGTAGAAVNIPAVGTGDFTVVFEYTPKALTANARVIAGADGAAFGLVDMGDGTLKATKQSAADVLFSNAGMLVAGTPIIVAYRRSGTSNSFLRNGVAWGAGTDSQNYTGNTLFVGAYNATTAALNGTLSALRLFNRALSDAELTALTARGLVTLPEQRGGSMTALNTSAFTNSGYDTFSGASATGFTAIETGVNGAASGPFTNWNFVKGARFLLSFNLTLNSGTAPYVGLAQFGVQWLSGSSALTTGQVRAQSGANSIVLTIRAVNAFFASGAGVGFESLEASNFVVSGLSIIPLGTLYELGDCSRDAGYVVRDTSGNGAHTILPASGVSIINPAKSGTVYFTTTTNGNQQLGGAQVIIPTNARILSWVVNSSGTPTVSLGNASAGAQYVSGAVMAAGNNDITLLTRFAATGNLWCNSNSTATLKHTVSWETIQT